MSDYLSELTGATRSMDERMDLVLVGLSYKTAPLEIRGQVAFPQERLTGALQKLHDQFGLLEGMIVSTCNRVEILGCGNGQTNPAAAVKSFLYDYHALSSTSLENYLYTYFQNDVVKHVFRVVSSLDSMVLGESQILSQMKRAYTCAREAGCVGAYLNGLIPRAFFVAKRVHSETRISRSTVSVSSVAVELARKIFGDLSEKSVLLLGAGEMGELAARNLINSGISRIFVANRSKERSDLLASNFAGTPVDFSDLDHYLVKSDIVIVSTGSRTLLLDQERVQHAVRNRKYRPLFIIDISVPRNVAPEVNNIENVFLYDIDDLQSVSEANLEGRKDEAELAERIVEQEVENYLKWAGSNHLGRLIQSLRTQIEDICLDELRKRQQDWEPQEYRRIEKILRQAAHKIVHPLILHIKQPDQNPIRQDYNLEMIKSAFHLDQTE